MQGGMAVGRLGGGILVVTLVALALVTGILSVSADTYSDTQVTDRSKIYFGDADRFTRPSVVVAMRVYAEISEYQEVRRRRLTRDDPDYYVLMERASRKFRSAIEKAAEAGGYDLVGEKGAVTRSKGTLPDLTDSAIEEVKKAQS